MKTLNYLILLVVMLGFGVSANAQDIKEETKTVIDKTITVDVYYFHNTRRCATCEAVEDVTKNTLIENYPIQMKDGSMSFQSINIEDSKNKALARELKVSGQTLLIVKGTKKKDLTNDAFLYARNSPEKLSKKIQKAIGTL